MLNCFAVLFYLFFDTIDCENIAPSYLLVTRVGPCYPKSKNTIVFTEFKVKQESKSENFTISGTLSIKSDVEDGWTIQGFSSKCVDLRNRDTCDELGTDFILHDCCKEKENLPIYHALAGHTEPKLSCPIKAGKYTIKDLPLSAKDHVKAPKTSQATSVFGYSIDIKAYNHSSKQVLGCMNILMRVWYNRNHDWAAAHGLWQTDVRQDRFKPTDVIIENIEDKELLNN